MTEEPQKYFGVTAIEFTALEDTNKMVFHSLGLEFDNTSLVLESSSDPDFIKMTNFPWSYDSVTSQVTIELSGTQTFRANHSYTFSVEYTTIPGDADVGFYRTSYLDDNGNKRWLITSQLEYIEARRSFPCFDEPGFKSVYKMTIIHDSTLMGTMSNMPIVNQTTL